MVEPGLEGYSFMEGVKVEEPLLSAQTGDWWSLRGSERQLEQRG